MTPKKKPMDLFVHCSGKIWLKRFKQNSGFLFKLIEGFKMSLTLPPMEVKNKCISNSSYLSHTASFHETMIMGERMPYLKLRWFTWKRFRSKFGISNLLFFSGQAFRWTMLASFRTKRVHHQNPSEIPTDWKSPEIGKMVDIFSKPFCFFG